MANGEWRMEARSYSLLAIRYSHLPIPLFATAPTATTVALFQRARKILRLAIGGDVAEPAAGRKKIGRTP
jgi:hypothetical protein